jgi:hypothetical protein
MYYSFTFPSVLEAMTIDLICALIKKTLPLSFLFRLDERNREEEEKKEDEFRKVWD